MYIRSQTFYVDSNSVNNSPSVFITQIQLYFKAKPNQTNNQSGIASPSVHVSISDCNASGAPIYSAQYSGSYVNIPYSSVNVSASAATATLVNFTQPVPLLTNKYYSINIQVDDPSYDLWFARAGDPVLATGQAFAGFTNFRGGLFDYATDGNITPIASTQLMFGVSVAQFTANSATYELVNQNFEFMLVANQNGTFTGGENIFPLLANATGTVSFTSGSQTITGSGTSFLTLFQTGSYITAYANTTSFICRKIQSIANNISLTVTEPVNVTNTSTTYFASPVGQVYHADQSSNLVYLTGSTANSTVYFSNTNTIVGDRSNANAVVSVLYNFPVTQYKPELGINVPQGGTISLQSAFAYTSGSNKVFTNSYFTSVDNMQTVPLSNYSGLLLSRSNELLSTNSPYLYSPGTKSGVIKVTLSQNAAPSQLYTSPYIYSEQLDIFAGKNTINNSYAGEHTNSGNGYCKHLSTIIAFDSSYKAQDLLVQASAFVPAGANVIAFAKIYNSSDSDTFKQKEWTLLSLASGNVGTSTTQTNNYIQMSWGMPNAPPSQYTANGSVSVGTTYTTLANTIVVGSGTNFSTEIVVGDAVKIYPPLFPNNYQVAIVQSIANSTQLTLNQNISNTQVQGTGLKIDKIQDKYQAFTNPQNSNIVRYYNTGLTEIDTYDTLQIKLVLTSNNTNNVPRVASLSAVGLSA